MPMAYKEEDFITKGMQPVMRRMLGMGGPKRAVDAKVYAASGKTSGAKQVIFIDENPADGESLNLLGALLELDILVSHVGIVSMNNADQKFTFARGDESQYNPLATKLADVLTTLVTGANMHVSDVA